MSFSRRRQGDENLDIWPGFVDALSTVLLVFIFVLVGFIASQVYLSGIISDKNSSLTDLELKLSDVCALLSNEKEKTADLSKKNIDLSSQIFDLNSSLNSLQSLFDSQKTVIQKEQEEKTSLEEKIKNLTNKLNDVLVALAQEQKSAQERDKALEFIKKENIKLSDFSKMNAYRSEFFDKLQSIVKDKEGIKIVGDRFVFQSELFFDTASADLSEEGIKQISNLADVIKEIGEKIPPKIKWILRVDGHTDRRKISGTNQKFLSNWELSSARAIAVVKQLIQEGIAPEHLVAAGFGENQPIAKGNSEDDYSKNRRIEFKLDER